MEQWPPLPSKVVTPVSFGGAQPEISVRSSQAETNRNQLGGTQGNDIQGDAQRKLDMNAEPTKKWENFFNSNRLSAKGMSLSYVNPVMKNREKVTKLKTKMIEKQGMETCPNLICCWGFTYYCCCGKYCAKCMQVGHKCHVKEGDKPLAPTRKVSKWQPKIDGRKVGEKQRDKEQVEIPQEEHGNIYQQNQQVEVQVSNCNTP
ncbi:hypothetical protein KY285_030610 [Solanum tuberosum]|nr:hypothetical protein KY285_030610 [Solanum tuberosum]